MPDIASRPLPSGPPRWPVAAVWSVVLYAIAGVTTMALPLGLREILLNLLNTAVFLHAGIGAMLRSRREASARLGWRLLGLALVAQALAQGRATLGLLRTGAAPVFPSWGDLFSFLSLMLVIASLLTWPLASASGSERLRKGLDSLGIAVSVFFISWFFALGPLFSSSASLLLTRMVMIGFFLANAMILGMCAYLGARQPERFRGPLGWIFAGFGLSLLQVTLQVPLSLAGRYHLGHPLDLLVLTAGLSILLASLSPQPLEPGPAPGDEARDSSISALLLPILPAATALSFAFGALLLAPHRLDPQIIGTGILLATLGLFRGLLVLRDLQGLSTALEARVQERTRALEAAQDLLLRTERLNSMASLGAGIAHDLKNLLGIVRLNSELLVEELGVSSPSVERHSAHLKDAADRAAGLATTLMAFGRGHEDPPDDVELIQRLRQLGALLRATLPPSIQFQVDLPSRPAFLHCQAGRLDQLVVNLVLNARDAMPEGGALLLRVAVTRDGDAPLAELAVSDTGVGIPEALQDRIFEPFFTTKAPGRGTGLGLVSVLQTVTELHGTLSLVSGSGRGTTFTLRLPVRV